VTDPGTIIDGRYKVLERIGSGGMAEVYLAEDQLLGRQLAVKVLYRHFAEDQEFVERFRREASSAAGLSHPNIVGIFDRGEWNGTYYIAMEYVPGRSLKTIVREQGALDPATAIDIAVQILRAARSAHKRGVIHRDLKPHNVILDEEGRARVTDFGIARAGASDMTMTGSIMGTAQYLSPEQAQGHTVSETSDLYSIGIILYELLTGVIPFEGETAVAIAFKQVSAEPRPPSQLNPALPPSLDTIVLRALAKDPAARYASAEEFIAALQHERQALLVFSGATAQSTADARAAAAAPSPIAGPLLLAPGDRFDGQEDPAAGNGHSRGRALLWALAAALVAGLAVLAFVLVGTGKTVRAPNVVGQTEQAAGTTLRHAGLSPAPFLLSSATVTAGLVISQTPPGGSQVDQGARVSIAISSGPASAGVTNVEGLSAAQAVAKLRKAGFKPTTKTEPSATVATGQAIATEPPADSELKLGSPVTVLVSSGPAPVRVPDVTGQTQAAAAAALTTAGLTVGAVSSRVSASLAPGTVISQSPSSGASLAAGGKVNLVVAQAPKEIAVPGVVGQNEAQAAAALGAAGFAPKTASATTTEPAQVGVVMEQSPAAGAQARKGATVTITVGVLGPQTTPTVPTTTPTTTTTTTTTTATPPLAPTG
jgi:beta-lactam-binding protein with PASTA domain/tRNA A-37 threonylcarbamoyl transferase component Bud32